MATITGDSVKYGMDADGGGVHDVIGTRCDPYTVRLMTGVTPDNTCHQVHGIVAGRDILDRFILT